MLADLLIQAGLADVVVAGGMESMTNALYLLASTPGPACVWATRPWSTR